MIQPDIKKETLYLEQKEKIRKFLHENNIDHVIRCIIDKLDSIQDLTLTQNVEMFRLVSCLEDAHYSYNKIFNSLEQNIITKA